MRIHALKKLKDDKKIKWREAYTDKSLFLKDQFEYAIGPKSYYRFEGKQVDGPGEWYVVIGPSGAHDVEPKWFCGIRKLPDSWPAGGKKWDNIVDAFNYAFDTWGVPKPKSIPRYTASDLRGIGSRIEEFKRAREQQEEKPVEKGSNVRIFPIKEGMAGGNIMRASLVWHAGEFEDLVTADTEESFNNLLRAGGFSSIEEAEAELERLRGVVGDTVVGSREHMPITMLEDSLKPRDESSATFVPWAREHGWIQKAMEEAEFEETSTVGAQPAAPALAAVTITLPDTGQETTPPVGGVGPLIVLEGLAEIIRAGGPDVAEAQLEMTFSGMDPVAVDVFFREGEHPTRDTLVKKIRDSAEDRHVINWASAAWGEMAPRRRMRVAALIAAAGRQDRLRGLPFDEGQLARQSETAQALIRRSPFEEGIEGSVNELRRLRNQFRSTHVELVQDLDYASDAQERNRTDNLPAHTYVEFSPRDGSNRILYLALYSGGQSFGQTYLIDDRRLGDERFTEAFTETLGEARGAAVAREAAAYFRAETTVFTVERTGWGNPVVARAFGNNMNRMQINEVLSGMSEAVGMELDNRTVNALRRVFIGGVVTLALTGGEDGGPLSVPVRNGAEQSLLYDALGGFWPGSYRLMDGLDKDRFPRGLVDKASRDMLDEIVISSSSRAVNSEDLLERVRHMAAAGGGITPETAEQIADIIGRRETWNAMQFHTAFPRLSSFDVINLFGTAEPSGMIVDFGTLKRFLGKAKLNDHLRQLLAPNRASAKLPDGSYPPGYKTHLLADLHNRFGDSISTADLSMFLGRYEGQGGTRFTGDEISKIVNGCLDMQGSRLEPVTGFIGSDFHVTPQSTARRTVRTPTMNLTGAGYVRLFRGLMNGVWNIRHDFPDLYERILRTQMLPAEAARSPEIAMAWRDALEIEDQNERLNVLDAIVDGILEDNAHLEPYAYFGSATQERQPIFRDNVLLRARLSEHQTPGMVQRQYDDLQGKVMGEVAKSLVLGAGIPGIPEDSEQFTSLVERLSNINVVVPRFATATVPSYLRRVGQMVMAQGGGRRPLYDADFEGGDDVVLLDRLQTPRISMSDVRDRRVCMYNLATIQPAPGENRPHNVSPNTIYQIIDWQQCPISRTDTFGTHEGVGEAPNRAPNQWTKPLIETFSEFYANIGRPCPYRPVTFKMTNSAVSASARSNYMLHSSREGESADHPVVDEMVTGARNFGEHIRMGLSGFYPLGELPYRQTVERLGPEAAALTGEQLASRISYATPMNAQLRVFLDQVVNMQEAIRGFSNDVDNQLVNAMMFDRRNEANALMLGEPPRPWYEFAFATPDEVSRAVRQLRPHVPAVVAAVNGYVNNLDVPFVRATALRQAIPYDVLSDAAFAQLFELPTAHAADAAESLRKGHIMRQIQNGFTGNEIFALADPEVVIEAPEPTGEWGGVVNAVDNVADVIDTVVGQHDAAEELAERQTEEETGVLIDEDADPDEQDAGNTVTVTEDTALDGTPEDEPSLEELQQRQMEELERMIAEQEEQRRREEGVPDPDVEELSEEELLRRQQEELDRMIAEQEMRERGNDEQRVRDEEDRGAAVLIDLLKTAREMNRIGLHGIAANINSLVRERIRAGTARRRVLLRTAASLSEVADELVREGKNAEAEEINRLASSYREKHERESGE